MKSEIIYSDTVLRELSEQHYANRFRIKSPKFSIQQINFALACRAQIKELNNEDQLFMAQCNTVIGNLYYLQGELDNAVAYYTDAYDQLLASEIHKQTALEMSLTAKFYTGLAHLRQGNIELAELTLGMVQRIPSYPNWAKECSLGETENSLLQDTAAILKALENLKCSENGVTISAGSLKTYSKELELKNDRRTSPPNHPRALSSSSRGTDHSSGSASLGC